MIGRPALAPPDDRFISDRRPQPTTSSRRPHNAPFLYHPSPLFLLMLVRARRASSGFSVDFSSADGRLCRWHDEIFVCNSKRFRVNGRD